MVIADMSNRRRSNIETNFFFRGFELLVGNTFADKLRVEPNPAIEFTLDQSTILDTMPKTVCNNGIRFVNDTIEGEFFAPDDLS